MVTPEYLDEVRAPLLELARYIPDNQRLLFENFALLEPTDAESVCQIHNEPEVTGDCRLIEDDKHYFFHHYVECYLLVERHPELDDVFVAVGPALIVPHEEFEEIDDDRRRILVQEWLHLSDEGWPVLTEDICDSVLLMVARQNGRLEDVYRPNRHPEHYGSDGPPVLFQMILKGQL